MTNEELTLKEIGLFFFLMDMNSCMNTTEHLGKSLGLKMKKIKRWTKEDWIRMCEKVRNKND